MILATRLTTHPALSLFALGVSYCTLPSPQNTPSHRQEDGWEGTDVTTEGTLEVSSSFVDDDDQDSQDGHNSNTEEALHTLQIENEAHAILALQASQNDPIESKEPSQDALEPSQNVNEPLSQPTNPLEAEQPPVSFALSLPFAFIFSLPTMDAILRSPEGCFFTRCVATR